MPEDIIRASAEEIAACDYALVRMTAPKTDSSYDAENDLWLPASIQYEEYTADSNTVRDESIAGDIVKSEIVTVYGVTVQEVKQNRSYYGKSATSNHEHDLDAIILVGHSYGGMIITGVAARMPEKISHLVYIDAAYPESGQSLYDLMLSGGQDPSSYAGFVPDPPYVENCI